MPSSRQITHAYAPSIRWTCIGRPDDPYKTLVDERGALLYDFINWRSSTQSFFFRRTFGFGLKFAGESVTVTQTTESARHPFVKTVIAYPHATLELLAFAHAHDGQRTDIVLWSVRSDETLDTAVWIDGQSLAEVFVLPDDSQPSHRLYSMKAQQWGHVSTSFSVPSQFQVTPEPSDGDPMLAVMSLPHTLEPATSPHYGPTPRYVTPIFTVTPDAPVNGAFVFPLNHDLTGDYDLAWAQDALVQERQFWTAYPLTSLDWQIPDGDVMDMVTACARNIMQARDVKDGLPEFQVGPTCYRGLWVVDGHFILEAARYLGHDRAGEQGITALLRRVQADGSIAQMPFHIKETGISIATFVRQCELDDDWERLCSMWSVVQNAVAYIRTLREVSKTRGEDALEYGLMPPTFGDGGLGGERPEYTTALWTLVGLKEAARAADKLGFVDDAAQFQADFDDLMAVFRQKAERDMQMLPDGTPYLPIAMPGGGSDHKNDAEYAGDVDDYHRINPGTGTWALAHAIYPGEVFAPDDPLVQNFCKLLDQLDNDEGIPAFTGWMPHDALWNYAASFYAHVWLYAGRPDKAIDYLYDFANHATPTRVWREEQSLRRASFEQLWGDMPHNWASAEFIRLARNLLVFEMRNQIHLLPALPPEWIQPGATIRLESTPTRYGPVDLMLVFDDSGDGTLTLKLDTAWSLQPESVVLHVPDGYVVNGNNGQITLGFVPEQTITLRKV